MNWNKTPIDKTMVSYNGDDYQINRDDSLTGFFAYPENSLSFPS